MRSVKCEDGKRSILYILIMMRGFDSLPPSAPRSWFQASCSSAKREVRYDDLWRKCGSASSRSTQPQVM